MRTQFTLLPALLMAAAVAACGGRPVENRAASAAPGFTTPLGPTVAGAGGVASPRDVCPPPPAAPPDGCTQPAPGPGGSTPAPTIPTSSYSWIPEGSRLDNAAAGSSGVIADTSTIQLTDGRWRMFLYNGGLYRSAVSPDGLSFTMDPGTRLPQGFGHIRVIRLSDGRMRAFNATSDGIVSSVSRDEGITFERESGTRLSTGAIGFAPSGISNIVRTAIGQYRLYFSDLPRPGGEITHKILSATSADLLTWTLDAGVRVGAGATLDGGGEHPAAIANPDGSVSLFYFRATNFKMLMATAADGLTFTSEFDTGLSNANDPDIVPQADGSVRMYYNWGDDAAGAIYSALYVGAPFAP